VLVLQCLVVVSGHAATAQSEATAASALIGIQDGPGAGAAGVDLYLEVTLNASAKGLVHFYFRDSELWASRTTLRQIGLDLPEEGADPVRLNGLRGLKVDYAASQQSVVLVAPLDLLKTSTTVVNTSDEPHPVASAAPGVLLNYNLYGTYGAHDTASLNAFGELRAFNSWGVFSTTELTQDSRPGNGQHNRAVRLDTSWTSSFPDDLLSLRIGDTLTDALSWSRATRIGGVQVGTDFALQPYLVTAPLPSFIGSATLPSDIQLYVNGIRQYSGQVPAGPFRLNSLPNINGAGNAQIVLTNALGQTTTLNFSLYGENQLLRQGLSDWSAEIGLVRQNYGLDSFDYGHDPVVSGTWRDGITDNFTAEGHAEFTHGLANAGLGGIWLLGRTGGILSASYAHSNYAGRGGMQYGLGYIWSDDRFNFSLSGKHASGDYRDVATLYGSPLPSLSAQTSVSYNFDHIGNLGLGYVELRYPQQSPARSDTASPATTQPDKSRYANAYWYKSVNRSLSLNLSFSQDLQIARNRTLFLVATLNFGNNTTVSGGIQSENGRAGLALNAVRPLPSQGGVGWRASLNVGDGQNGSGGGELDYLGRYGQVQAGVYDASGARYGYGSVLGSLVLMDGDVFAARQIADGFAVVSTSGIAGVPVSLQNNPVGTTDSRGLLLVTPLNSYQTNKIGIDPMDLPADLNISKVDLMATPADRSGTLVKFDIRPIRAASVVLVDTTGKPLPLGSQVRLRGQDGEPALVGFDGAVYLDTLDEHNALDVTTPSGICHVRFDHRKQDSGIPQIGPLTCTRGSP
jgi:outer membrane usher protein